MRLISRNFTIVPKNYCVKMTHRVSALNRLISRKFLLNRRNFLKKDLHTALCTVRKFVKFSVITFCSKISQNFRETNVLNRVYSKMVILDSNFNYLAQIIAKTTSVRLKDEGLKISNQLRYLNRFEQA